MTALSIIIPALNEADGIVDVLSALEPLRARGAEIIVVDGGSEDRTVDLARPYCNRLLLAPRGRAAQMNAGAAAALGQILLFLHADTRPPPDADQLVCDGLLRGRVWGRFDVRIAGIHSLLPVIAMLMNVRSRLTGIATGDQAIFVDRRAFAAAGGFPNIPLMEDIVLSRRLKRLGRPLCLSTPVLTSGRRWETHGVLRTIVLMWRLRLAFFLGAKPTSLHASMAMAQIALEPIAIAVLSKAPGSAKTRLQSVLGAEGAAALQTRFIARTLETARAAGTGPVTLWATPDETHPAFRTIVLRPGLSLARQPEGDLGRRMDVALTSACPALVIGTDCPALTPEHLRDAAAVLRNNIDVVLIPVDDGGYALIGARKPYPQLFTDMAWGTATVMADTRRRMTDLGLSWRELERLWDVDDPADLERLRREGFAYLIE